MEIANVSSNQNAHSGDGAHVAAISENTTGDSNMDIRTIETLLPHIRKVTRSPLFAIAALHERPEFKMLLATGKTM